MIFYKLIVRGLSCWSKIPCGSPTIGKILLSSSIKTLWPAHTATSSKDRQIGAYSFGLTNLGKLSCQKEDCLSCLLYMCMCVCVCLSLTLHDSTVVEH
jgi:hypothetical protein